MGSLYIYSSSDFRSTFLKCSESGTKSYLNFQAKTSHSLSIKTVRDMWTARTHTLKAKMLHSSPAISQFFKPTPYSIVLFFSNLTLFFRGNHTRSIFDNLIKHNEFLISILVNLPIHILFSSSFLWLISNANTGLKHIWNENIINFKEPLIPADLSATTTEIRWFT